MLVMVRIASKILEFHWKPCESLFYLKDGWAISMLKQENLGWQSICNGVGQMTGVFLGKYFIYLLKFLIQFYSFLGNYIFITLESVKFCNQYIRPTLGLSQQNYGIISLQGKYI